MKKIPDVVQYVFPEGWLPLPTEKNVNAIFYFPPNLAVLLQENMYNLKQK